MKAFVLIVLSRAQDPGRHGCAALAGWPLEAKSDSCAERNESGVLGVLLVVHSLCFFQPPGSSFSIGDLALLPGAHTQRHGQQDEAIKSLGMICRPKKA